MNSSPDISLILPCLNESQSLAWTIHRCQILLQELEIKLNLNGEIIVSDNGSTDGSQDIAASLGATVIHCSQKGYGNALKDGIKAARGHYLVMGDADGSYDFVDAFPMIEKLVEGYDLCMGSRLKGEIKEGAMPWKNRYIGNPVLSGMLNLFFHSGLSDAHCGLRAFTREAIKKINPSSNGMEFASEIVIKATLHELKNIEVPITLYPDKRNRKPHLRPWRDGWRHLRYLLMLSPLWLFFLPSLIFALGGISILGSLIINNHQKMVDLIGFQVGDHWAIISGGMLSISAMLFILGLASMTNGLVNNYKKQTRTHEILLRISRLEVILITGLIISTVGSLIFIYIIYTWSQNNFGELSMIREMVLANTLFIIGMEFLFGGFLIPTIADNNPDFIDELKFRENERRIS